MSKYGHRTIDWFEAIVNKLGGEEAADRFLRDELVVSAIERTKKIWNRIKVGTFKDVAEIRKALKEANVNVSTWASSILDKVTVSATKEEFDLVNVSLAELGFKRSASWKDIYDQALKSGLELCSAEDGPQAVLQFGGQLKKCEWFGVWMEPITDSVGDLRVFSVERESDGELWLRAYGSSPDSICDVVNRFVFRRRKR